MVNKMKDYLPEIEMDKMKTLLDVEERYETGKITLEEAREIMRTKVGKIRPYHIAYMEQTLKDGAEDECVRVDMRKVNELLEGFMDTSRPELPADHPLTHYYKENDEMRKLLLAAEDLVQYPVIKNQWLELYDQFRQYPKHYHRKQNQLYPLLEKKGFDRPTTTMWNFDDIVRDEIKRCYQLLEDGKDDEFIAAQKEMIALARDLMDKEERILYPTSLALISPAEFEDMKSGDQEIGFAFFDVKHEETPKTTTTSTADDSSFAADLQALLKKHGYSVGSDQELDVTTGKLTLEQINLIYKHLPVDISFVDEHELVKFYSDTDHRIFPRSKNVIGREVSNCHPRKSVHIVKEIVEKFRNGEQDNAEFWINKPEVFLYIVYFAVHDDAGNFRGVLEMMQDCTHIRSLTDSQTLLTWKKGGEISGQTVIQENSNESHNGNTADAKNAADTSHTQSSESPQRDKKLSAADITADTLLKDIFEDYPALKDRMEEISPKFKMLKTPLARIMLPKATIKIASERTGVELNTLIAEIKKRLGK